MLDAFKSEEAQKLIPKIYDDLLQPGVRKVGLALETVLGLSTTILLPVRLANDKALLLFQKHMNNYKAKLEQVPEANIVAVPTEIGLPILERLTYTTNEEIADLFTTLLSKASDDRTANQAHPGFVQILQRLSVDEARIVKYLGTPQSSSVAIHILSLSAQVQYPIQVHNYLKKTSLHLAVNFLFPENVHAYVDNLAALGIIVKLPISPVRVESFGKNQIPIIEYMKHNSYQLEGFQSTIDTLLLIPQNFKQAGYSLTDYGILFVSACALGQ